MGSTRGMTLLELVVGLTVTGLVLSAGFGAVAMLGDRRQQAEAVMNAVTRAANERAQIESWIAGARLVADEGGPDFRGLDGVRDGTPDDELTFLTTAPTPLGTGETLVRLYVARTLSPVPPLHNVERGSGGEVHNMERRSEGGVQNVERGSGGEVTHGLTAVFVEWRGTATRRIELDESVTGIDIRYLSGVMGQHTWLPSWISSTVLPAGVEVRLVAAAGDTLPPLLRLPIVVPLRSGR